MAATSSALALSNQLARFDRVDVRKVWPSESSDFTPWLSRPENISLLGEAIDLELQVEGREQRVGPFRADILCQDVATGGWVLIENQLEATDHSHLGQSITYAAGLSAETVVWVATSFTEEHLAAIAWLNEITNERHSFFAIEIEAWRIGGSPVAPRFNVVAKPNGWRRSVARREQGSEELTEGQRLQLQYWTGLKAHLAEHPGAFRIRTPLSQNWMTFPLGRSSWFLAASLLLSKGRIAVGLTLKSPQAKTHFQTLLAQREAIEAELGQPLEWLELPLGKESRIEIRREVDGYDEAAWPQFQAWHREQLAACQRVFGPRLAAIDAAETSEA